MTIFFLSLFPLLVAPCLIGLFLFRTGTNLSTRWWFGSVLLGIFLIVFHGLRLPVSFAHLSVLMLMVTAIFYAVRTYRKNPAFEKTAVPINRFDSGLLLFWIILGPIILAAAVHVLSYPVHPRDWDAIAIWYRRVKLLGDWVPLQNTAQTDWGGNYINYPFLGPMLESFTLKISSGSESYGRLLFPLAYLFWALSLFYFAPRQKKWFYGLIVSLSTVLFFDLSAFTNGYQEGFLTTLAGMSAIHFCRTFSAPSSDSTNLNTSTKIDYFLGFFFAGALSFVKTEGMFLGIILAVCALIIHGLALPSKDRSRYLVFIVPYAGLFIFLTVLWPLILLANHLDLSRIQENSFTLANLLKIRENLNRWGIIRPFVATYLQAKGIVLSSLLLMSLLAAWFARPSRKPVLFLWSVYLLHCLFVIAPYFVTGANPIWHLKNSFDRLMFQHLFFYATVLSLASGFLTDTLLKSTSPIPAVPATNKDHTRQE